MSKTRAGAGAPVGGLICGLGLARPPLAHFGLWHLGRCVGVIMGLYRGGILYKEYIGVIMGLYRGGYWHWEYNSPKGIFCIFVVGGANSRK